MNNGWKNKFDFVAEEGRQDIYQRYERRQSKQKQKGFFRKRLRNFRVFAFNKQTARSFSEHFNLMVIFQIIFAAGVTFLCDYFNLVYDIHTSLFISPIVFPLAFSINTDFQRKEKVLDDLALFKSSAMMWIFCMRDWREACGFDDQYMKGVRDKIKGLMYHLRIYLFTENQSDRQDIVYVIYEDLSDANQINEKVRCSEMISNGPLVSRTVHFLNLMCLSFERLRVIREYRSPRSIRSFTKVLIFFLPILLSPYYLHLGRQINNIWSPYYISVMVAFVFAALQGVQDKLDDPFDGMSEDDIKLDSLEEWAFHNLEATAHRSYKVVGRFQVSNPPQAAAPTNCIPNTDQTDYMRNSSQIPFKRENVYRHNMMMMNGGGGQHRPPISPLRVASRVDGGDDFELHPYASVLNNIKGNTTILRGGQVKNHYKSFDDLSSHASTRDMSTSRLSQYSTNHQRTANISDTMQRTPSGNGFSRNSSVGHLQSLHHLAETISPISIDLPASDSPLLEFTESDVPLSGVKSYLLNMLMNQENGKSRSRSSSTRSNGSAHSRNIPSTSSPSQQHNETHEAKPVFFIGDPSESISPTKTIRKPSPLLRSHSLPDSNDLEPVEINNSAYRHAQHLKQPSSRSETPPPCFPQAKNHTEKSRFTVRRNPISFSTEPLLNSSRCPDSDDESGCDENYVILSNTNVNDVISSKGMNDASNFPNGIVNGPKESPIRKGPGKSSTARNELKLSPSSNVNESPSEFSPELASLFNNTKVFHDTTF